MDLNDGAAGGGESGSAADMIGGAGAGAGSGANAGAAGDGGGAAGEAAQSGGDMAGAADPDWYSGLSAEPDGDKAGNRDWVKAKGFKDTDGLVKAYRAAEQALHDSGRVKVPGEGASAEELAAFNKAIGVPDDAKGYKLPELKDADGNPVALNVSKLGLITEAAHKHGIPARALEGVLQEIATTDALELAAQEADLQQRAQAHAKKWGDQQDAKVAGINAAARELGISRDELLAIRAALGPERALDLMADLGSRMSEDVLVRGGGADARRFGVSAAEAKAQYDKRMADPAWRSKAMVPGTAERQEQERLVNAMAAAADREAAQA